MDNLLSTSDVAKILHIGRDRVVQLANRGTIPHTRTAGGVRIFKLEDVEEVRTQRIKDNLKY